MKTIICEKNDAVRQAAEIVSGLLKEKPDAVLALACGETMAPLWAELSRACTEGACSLKDARILCATELCGVSEEKSCRRALTKGLIEMTDARKENCFFPDPDAPEKTDARIKELGLKAEDYWWYTELRKFGGVVHAGFGLGFERLVMYLTGISNIRDAIPYPRTTGSADF